MEIKSFWPRTHSASCALILTLSPRCPGWEAPWKLFLDILELFRKIRFGLEREKNCFTLSWEWNWRTFFMAFGKDFKWVTFQKECIIQQMSEVEPSSRGFIAMMVSFYPGSPVALPGDLVISLQVQSTGTSQASNRRRAGPKWCLWGNYRLYFGGRHSPECLRSGHLAVEASKVMAVFSELMTQKMRLNMGIRRII